MKGVLLAATALSMIAAAGAPAYAGSNGIKAGTYSISVTGFCDHMTIILDSSGDAYGSSDTSACDTSALMGVAAKLKATVAPGGPVLQVGGDLGYGSTEAWSWSLNFKTLTGTLRGTSGNTLIAGPLNFAITETSGVVRGTHANNGAKSATSLLRN